MLAALVVAGGLLLAGCLPASPPAPPPAPVSACNPWRGYVVAADHNYAGIGAYNGSTRFMCKDTPTQGVRAQIQHLRNYADATSTPSTLGNPFEPRLFYDEAAFLSFVYHGAAPTWRELGGKWAPSTTYGTAGVMRIYNEMRAGATLPAVDVDTYTIMGRSELTAAQMAARVCAVGRCTGWRPEITPVQMAQLFLDEGAAAGVRGDVAFAQSILETGWFNWPSSPATAAATVDGTEGAPDPAAGDPVLDWYFELRAAASRD
ncbi:MAG TPA: hypothetical protein VFW06_09220 [Acidimicrobiia bacterium]|nr:hypothetical protein [Acidimicrobiia bacterium]